MTIRRSAGWNVYLYIFPDEDTPIGGMRQIPNQEYTNSDLYYFVDILVPANVADSSLEIIKGWRFYITQRNSAQQIKGNDEHFTPGHYVIHPHDSRITLIVNKEQFVPRVQSHTNTPRDGSFRRAIRERDLGCAISGRRNRNYMYGDWVAFQAAHIFPLTAANIWIKEQLYQYISDMPDSDDNNKLNSPQNGMLLDAGIHILFDQYLVGVNPDKNYKIYLFHGDDGGLDQLQLIASAREDGENGVRDGLLRWHFRQCVLANMRGAGEVILDYDPDDPGDVVGEILRLDSSGDRLGLELASRLALTPYMDSPSA